MSVDPKNKRDILDDLSTKILDGLVRGTSIMVLVLVIGLVYLLAGDHLKEMWSNFKYSVEVKSKPKMIYDKQVKREVVNGIHQETGLAYGPGFTKVKSVCLSCHSSALIIQNKATAEGWDQMLTWMQRTQGLPPLGTDRKVIVNYLATYYGPVESGRRPNLNAEEIEWYVLELN